MFEHQMKHLNINTPGIEKYNLLFPDQGMAEMVFSLACKTFTYCNTQFLNQDMVFKFTVFRPTLGGDTWRLIGKRKSEWLSPWLNVFLFVTNCWGSVFNVFLSGSPVNFILPIFSLFSGLTGWNSGIFQYLFMFFIFLNHTSWSKCDAWIVLCLCGILIGWFPTKDHGHGGCTWWVPLLRPMGVMQSHGTGHASQNMSQKKKTKKKFYVLANKHCISSVNTNNNGKSVNNKQFVCVYSLEIRYRYLLCASLQAIISFCSIEKTALKTAFQCIFPSGILLMESML